MHIFLQRTRVMFMPQRYPKHRMENSKSSALESCMQEPIIIDIWGAAPERWEPLHSATLHCQYFRFSCTSIFRKLIHSHSEVDQSVILNAFNSSSLLGCAPGLCKELKRCLGKTEHKSGQKIGQQ